jgi:mRNA (2'-O-methyladenosine-N6-)-methyltransferase
MELSYGTLTDDEMRDLDLSNIHHPGLGGFVFIWATSRSVEVARDCLRIWGYQRVDEIVWLKTNQVGGTVRSGRTGHWLNHNKEHCLVGMKGDVCYANVGRYRQDCDVIVSPVRENSRKPDELYSIIERLVNGRLCLELFGRRHNRRPGWITMGNQLEGTHVTPHPEIAHRLSQLEI